MQYIAAAVMAAVTTTLALTAPNQVAIAPHKVSTPETHAFFPDVLPAPCRPLRLLLGHVRIFPVVVVIMFH